MVFAGNVWTRVLTAGLCLGLLSGCIHKKYENPISKNTQQPDKILFDQAIKDIEHGRYEVARISLQTLMNTYESSEYLAKAKLAIADSWYREGGSNGLAQAEAEYKDFILFYPTMPESAEAQNRVCEIHYRQMEKSDRDWSQTLRAETECRQVLLQFPNSKFAPVATQRLREIQESLAEHEFVVGNFYWKREMMPAAANRLTALVDQYPLYSKAGESLYEAGDAYAKMGPRFRKQAGEQFARVIRDYPLSPRADDAARRLEEMEMPVPKPSEAALQRAKFEQANYHKPGLMARSYGFLKSGPDVTHAAHTGAPTMTDPKRTIPVSIPVPAVASIESGTEAGAAATGTTDVSITQPGSNSALEKNPDVRSSGGIAANSSDQAAQQPQQPLPTNRDAELKKLRQKQAKAQAKMNKKKKSKEETGSAAPASTQTPPATPGQSPAGTPAPSPSTQPSAAQPATPPLP
jgi:outer membrane protein assembly factor BamD